MGKGLTAAQRRAVAGAEPSTGRVAARPEVCAALVTAGLAVRHGRTGHVGWYLTPEGRRVRAELAPAPPAAAGTEPAPERKPEPEPERGRFVADDGSGAGASATAGAGAAAGAAGRSAEVAAAWEGLLQIRAVLGSGEVRLPAAWERERPVHAVALALEAAGVPPSRGADRAGYRVAPSNHPGLTEVTWSEPAAAAAALSRVAGLLDPLGWQATEHQTRSGAPFPPALPPLALGL